MSGSDSRSHPGSADGLPIDCEAAAPPSLARLFGEFDAFDPLAGEARQLVICRLLEEGERDDLRWLAEAVGEEEISRCFEDRSRRQISRRSSRFWSLVLKVAPPGTDPVREALWPL